LDVVEGSEDKFNRRETRCIYTSTAHSSPHFKTEVDFIVTLCSKLLILQAYVGLRRRGTVAKRREVHGILRAII